MILESGVGLLPLFTSCLLYTSPERVFRQPPDRFADDFRLFRFVPQVVDQRRHIRRDYGISSAKPGFGLHDRRIVEVGTVTYRDILPAPVSYTHLPRTGGYTLICERGSFPPLFPHGR